MCDAFIPLLNPMGGRIVNVGSGAGPMYMKQANESTVKMLCDTNITWEQICALEKEVSPKFNPF